MHQLKNALYGKVYQRVGTARQTGNVSRVVLIQQRIAVMRFEPPLYHVGLVVMERDDSYIFEHGPVKYDPYREWSESIAIPLPSVHQTIRDIQHYESTLPEKYIVGIRDCRHHVIDLLDFLYDE